MMNHFDIVHALNSLRCGAQWNLRGDDLSDLEWMDTAQIRPTDDEITAAISTYVPPPTLEEKVNAILQGGKALADMQARVSALKQGGPVASSSPT